MDQKLLDSLNNLSLALEQIAEALKDKSEAQSATAKAMQGGDFIKEIKEINVGVKQLQKDTKEILKNQQTIMSMAKKGADKKSAAEDLGEDKKAQKNFKEGIGVILLLAVAVLALGVAFNLIGKVNFLSVIALSIALPLLAIGFAKVVEALKKTGFEAKKDGVNFVLTIAAISLGIVLASWAFQLIRPIAFSQFLTAVGISIAFVVISYGLKKMLNAFKGMNMATLAKTVLFLPLVMPAVSLAIALSSYAFQLIKPVGIAQLFTAIFISIAFTVIAYGLNKILTAFKDISPAKAIMAALIIPILFVAISYAIAVSSMAFSNIVPISFSQFLTAVAIAAVFVVISFGLKLLTDAISKLKWRDVLLIPALFTVMSLAITISSFILSKATPIPFGKLLSILAFTIITSISIVIIGAAMWILNKIGLNIPNAIKGGVVIILIAAAIAVSSLLLSMGNYRNYPSFIWIVGRALSFVVIGVVMMVFNKIGLTIANAIKGGIVTIVISAAIMVSSLLLNLGKYKNYPNYKWAIGVALSLGAFGLGAVLLGTQALNPFFYAGLGVILVVAGTIVATSYILATGNYKKYPSFAWAMGVGLALSGFGLGAVLLGTQVFNPFFYAGLGMILVVAGTILATSLIFAQGNFDTKKFPSMAWVLGATGVISGMGLIAAALAVVSPLIIIGSVAILAVAGTIMVVDRIFQKGKFNRYPSMDWINGVSLTMTKWSKLMDSISFGTVASAGIADLFGGGLSDVAESIVNIAKIFSKAGNVYVAYPTTSWVGGVKSTVFGFMDIFKQIESRGFTASSLIKYSTIVGNLISNIAMSARILWLSQQFFKFKLDPSWVSSLSKNVIPFAKLSQDLDKMLGRDEIVSITKGGFLGFGATTTTTTVRKMQDLSIVNRVVSQMGDTAKILYYNKTFFSFKLDEAWVKNLGNSVRQYASLTRALESLLTNEEKITTKTGYWDVTITTTTKRTLKDISIVNRVVSQMVDTARMLTINKRFFAFRIEPGWVRWLASSVMLYASLTRSLEEMLTTEEKITTTRGFWTITTTTTTVRTMKDVSIINRVTSQMVSTAALLWTNRRYFSFKVDPNYMRAVASNIVTFANLANYLEKNGPKYSVVDEILGLDPISRVARGMVRIASAYDKLASAVKNFSGAINSLNIVKLHEFRKLTGNLAVFSAMDSGMFSNMLKVLETRAGVFAKFIDIQERKELAAARPQVKAGGAGVSVGGKKDDGQHKDAKGETQLQKLDKIFAVLVRMQGSVASIDSHLQNPLGGSGEIGKTDFVS